MDFLCQHWLRMDSNSRRPPNGVRKDLYDAYLSTGMGSRFGAAEETPPELARYLEAVIRRYLPRDRGASIADLACGGGDSTGPAVSRNNPGTGSTGAGTGTGAASGALRQPIAKPFA